MDDLQAVGLGARPVPKKNSIVVGEYFAVTVDEAWFRYVIPKKKKYLKKLKKKF